MRTDTLGIALVGLTLAAAASAQVRTIDKAKAAPIATKTVITLGAKPDLIVCKYEPVKLTGAGRQQLRFRVYNVDTAPAPYHLLWADFGAFKNKLPVPPLKPGEFKEWIYPQANVGGGYQTMYTFWVDRDLWVNESDENNNQLDGVVKIDASEPAKCSDGKLH